MGDQGCSFPSSNFTLLHSCSGLVKIKTTKKKNNLLVLETFELWNKHNVLDKAACAWGLVRVCCGASSPKGRFSESFEAPPWLLKNYIWFPTMGCHICSQPDFTELWTLWNFLLMAHFKHLSCIWGRQHGKADQSEPSHNMKEPWRIYKHIIRSQSLNRDQVLVLQQ